MLIRHLLYPSELSSLTRSTGIEPVPGGDFPAALPLGDDRILHSAEHGHAMRTAPAGTNSPNPGPSEGAGLCANWIPNSRRNLRLQVAAVHFCSGVWRRGHSAAATQKSL